MKDYYTNVMSVGNNILYRGIKNGRRVKMKIAYAPTLFLPSNNQTEYKTLNGENLEPMKFSSIRDAREFVESYKDVNNFSIYGNSRFEYAFIAEHFFNDIEWDINLLNISIIDIEVGSENGFPNPYKADEAITAITIKKINGSGHVFGCGEFVNDKYKDYTYIKCKDEYDLCKKFLTHWIEDYPDAVSGWNIKFFDIPYLVNRFNKILGESETKKFSPWNYINEREVVMMNAKQKTYDVYGIATLDYLELYRWFAPSGKSQESYKLNHIAHVELKRRKLSYDEYESLHQLYKLNYQLFIEYNIVDVELILELENKLKLLELALTIAYDTKSNFTDVFAQTRMWDSLTNCYLLKQKIIVPQIKIKSKNEAFEGAYVKDPQVGMHDWIASFDLDSLYPHLMMQYNISPETLIEPENYTDDMRRIISDGVSVERMLKKQIDLSSLNGVTITPNGQFFRCDKQGFLPKMLEEMYEDRKKFKNMMIDAKKQLQIETDNNKKEELKNKIARYNNLQLAKKVSLNSAYGALGSQYFRFYDLRQAVAVTLAGQLSIRWIENKLNSYMNNILKTDIDYVLASDTDSIYLRLSELVNKVYGVNETVSLPKQKVIEFMDRVCEERIQPYINSSYQELADYVHAYKQKMRMKREALSDKGIWTAKKRYILNVYNNEGVQYKEPELKVMGLEMVKSSTPAAIREKMHEIIQLMVTKNESDVQQFIEDFRKEFNKLQPEDISFPRGMNGIKEYSHASSIYTKGTPIHVKGALLYNHYLKSKGLTMKYPLIQDGEKIKFSYLKMPNPFKDTVISYSSRLPKEFGLHEFIDYDMQFQKTFLDPVNIILKCIGWNHEKVNTLESFFE